MTQVAVVTDSTAYLPADVVEKHGVTVVPLQVQLGDRSLLEGVDLAPAEFAQWISRPGHRASTSQPTPAAFAAAYDDAAADDVVSIHLAGSLSGTVQAARVAAEAAGKRGRRVRVIDSGQIAMAMGFAVIAAAEAATAGASVNEVVAAAELAASRTRMFFYVETLDYLRRGGRIGAAASLIGTALAVKPLLHLRNGQIAPLEKVRTASRAIARMEEIALFEVAGEPAEIAVHHLAAAERAAATAERLRAAIPTIQSMHVSEVGAVVGAHVGPGMLGVAVHRL